MKNKIKGNLLSSNKIRLTRFLATILIFLLITSFNSTFHIKSIQFSYPRVDFHLNPVENNLELKMFEGELPLQLNYSYSHAVNLDLLLNQKENMYTKDFHPCLPLPPDDYSRIFVATRFINNTANPEEVVNSPWHYSIITPNGLEADFSRIDPLIYLADGRPLEPNLHYGAVEINKHTFVVMTRTWLKELIEDNYTSTLKDIGNYLFYQENKVNLHKKVDKTLLKTTDSNLGSTSDQWLEYANIYVLGAWSFDSHSYLWRIIIKDHSDFLTDVSGPTNIIRNNDDEGFYLLYQGTTYSSNKSDVKGVVVLKIDFQGNILWEKHLFNENNFSEVIDTSATLDTERSYTFFSNGDLLLKTLVIHPDFFNTLSVVLTRLDKNTGEVLWRRVYDESTLGIEEHSLVVLDQVVTAPNDRIYIKGSLALINYNGSSAYPEAIWSIDPITGVIIGKYIAENDNSIFFTLVALNNYVIVPVSAYYSFTENLPFPHDYRYAYFYIFTRNLTRVGIMGWKVPGSDYDEYGPGPSYTLYAFRDKNGNIVFGIYVTNSLSATENSMFRGDSYFLWLSNNPLINITTPEKNNWLISPQLLISTTISTIFVFIVIIPIIIKKRKFLTKNSVSKN